MNWTTEWLHSPDYFCVSLSGTFSLKDAWAAVGDISRQLDFNNGDSLLVDDTQMDMGHINGSDIEAMSGMMGQFNAEIGLSKIAIVGCSDLQFGLARQFQIKTESHSSADVRAFRYEAAAVEWFSSELPVIDPTIPFSVPLLPPIRVT